MNDDLTELASAYLDGAVTAAERGRVEADADLLAEVERLRQVRAMLGDTEPASISTREKHLAAALDAWDRLPAPERTGLLDATPSGADAAAVAGAASVTSVTSIADHRRWRANRRVLAVAAGLVVVLGGGLVARSALRSTDDADTGANAAVADEPVELSARDELELRAADETFDADGGAGGAEDIPAEATAAVPAEDGDPFLGSDEAPPDDELVLLSSVDDLAAYADLLLREPVVEVDDAPSADIEPAFALCGVDRIVGPARWSTGGTETLVVVGIDDDAGEAVAYDDETCNVVARTPLPRR